MNILFENSFFIAVHKPAGWLSVVSRDKNDPRPCLAQEIQISGPADRKKIWPCHRLDVEVSGVILFAKTSESHRAANLWFEGHQLQKGYEALSAVPNSADERTLFEKDVGQDHEWRSLLARGKKRAYEAPFGKEAITIARLKSTGEKLANGIDFWRWELMPKTGRSHQLRYEMFKRQMPILGDELYSSKVAFPQEGIALRSVFLDFQYIDQKTWGLPNRIEAPIFSV